MGRSYAGGLQAVADACDAAVPLRILPSAPEEGAPIETGHGAAVAAMHRVLSKGQAGFSEVAWPRTAAGGRR